MSPDPVLPVKRSRKRRPLLPGLLRRKSAARYCSTGLSTWDRLAATGHTPAPIKLGGSVLWSRRELRAWMDHGCPPRATWSPIWQTLVTARRTGRAR